MGRDIGRHTHGNSLCPVDQKVGNPHRQDLRLLLCLIKIGTEIHHILVHVGKVDLLGKLLQLGLGITHSRSPVPLDGAKIPMAIHQGHTLLKLLFHHHQGLIDGAVSVGVIFTHGVADNTG